MLTTTIQNDLISALKKKDSKVVSTLRLLMSELHNARIAKGLELTEDEIIREISKEAKKRRESIEVYEKAGRLELAKQEKAELSVLTGYLPSQLPKDEIEKIVDEVILEVEAKSMADIGKVMAKVMHKIATRADGAAVSLIVRKKLGA